MKFTLKSYSDLGRCSMGTLLDEFDSENYEIRLKGEIVPVKSIEDLFPFLWQHPGIGGQSGEKKFACFYETGTHWHHDYDKSIKKYKLDILKLKKKIAKTEKPELVAKYEKELDCLQKHMDSLIDMLARLDEEMEEQKKKLIKDNQ